ncbi:MAG: lycopene beta-cyclase CrtY [Allosphingosinicella sp.]
MARGRRQGVLIAGGGVAGSLAALALAKLRPDVPLLLVGENAHFGGDRTLFLLDDSLGGEEMKLAEALAAQTWTGHYAAFPGRSRKLGLACRALAPDAIDRAVRETLRPDQYRAEAKIVAVRDQSLLLHGGETIAAEGAIDARDTGHLSTLELGWRKSVSQEIRFEEAHRVDLPVAADATTAQDNSCSFFSLIPFGETRLRIEETRVSTAPDLDMAAAGERIAAYAARRGWKGGTVERVESDVAPIALGGDFQAYWRLGGARVAKLGVRGGFFHPTTGCTASDAFTTSLLLAGQRDYSGAALHDLFETTANAAWKRRETYRSFNRALIGGAGCSALAGLYELDAALIGRFFGERLGLLDRRKVLGAAAR